MLNIIIFGPPASGKGTQSAKIAENYGLVHLSTGDLFRREIENQTDIGNKVDHYISQGQLVPDNITLRLVYKHATRHNLSKGIIFDGFPRTLNQAKLLDRMLEKRNMYIHRVIGIKVNKEELINRIRHRSEMSDRSDDTEAIIHQRMKTYQEQTYPVIEYYKGQGKYKQVSGMASIETVSQRICNIIDQQ